MRRMRVASTLCMLLLLTVAGQASASDGHVIAFGSPVTPILSGSTTVLSGIGQAADAKLEASPPLVTFSGIAVGELASASATFRNVASAPLTIDAVHLPSAPFAAEGAPAPGSTIEPGASVTITVTFHPTEAGHFSGEIGLETSGGNEAIGLSASAGAPGALEITNKPLEYGQVTVGSSEFKSFTITNTGGTAVEVTKSKPPIGGAFTATTTLSEGTTIAPQESLTETVEFTPSSTGPANDMWAINGKDTTGRHEVEFIGSGVAAQSITPSTESGATASRLVTPLGGISAFTETKEPLLSLTKLQLRASAARSNPHPHRFLVSYTLSASAKVELALYRRIVRHHCPAADRTCTRWSATKVKLEVNGHPGANHLTLSFAGLPAGDYRLDAPPVSPRGIPGSTRHLHFNTSRLASL
jgi:hypothetical protein